MIFVFFLYRLYEFILVGSYGLLRAFGFLNRWYLVVVVVVVVGLYRLYWAFDFRYRLC